MCCRFRPLLHQRASVFTSRLSYPRSRVQNAQKKRTRAYRFSGGNPAFPAQWLYGLCRALPGDEFLFVTVAERIDGDLTRLGRFRLRSTWHQQRMPGPHDFAVRSDLHQPLDQPCAAGQNFGEGVEAPFVRAPVDHSQAKPALRLHLRANAAASTASHPASVTTRDPPLLPGWDGASW